MIKVTDALLDPLVIQVTMTAERAKKIIIMCENEVRLRGLRYAASIKKDSMPPERAIAR
jgi:hypothetical protein